MLKTIEQARPKNGFALVLIGSAARNTSTAQSDLDLLVLASPKIDVRRTPDRLHVQSMDEGSFVERLRSGDDFAAWCVRYGVPIATSDFWLKVTNSPEAAQWPDWRQKIPHAARRLALANYLVSTGDLASAAEEALYAATHTGRAILFKNQEFPLSRPEMIQQLQQVQHTALAELIKALIYDEPTHSLMRRTIRYIKRLLIHLDRPQYQAFVEERRMASESKNRSGSRQASKS